MTQIVLNVSTGYRQSGTNLPPVFLTSNWQELRLDIDPINEPDILGTMLDMSAVESEIRWVPQLSLDLISRVGASIPVLPYSLTAGARCPGLC